MSRNKNKISHRKERVGELLHRGIATVLSTTFKDPRVGLVTLSEVDVSKDLKQAKVFFTVLDDDSQSPIATVILNQAIGFFRSELAKVTNLRVVPNLKFVFDKTQLKGRRIESLLNEINNGYGRE